MEPARNKTRKLMVGNLAIGGGSPVSVQTMTKTDTRNVKDTIDQIRKLEEAGAELIRLAVKDEDAAKALVQIRAATKLPMVADIHLDYKLALAALESKIDGLRINPGNIGARWKVEEVVRACKERKIPIRIGVNSGSLEKDLLQKYQGATAQAMVESAIRHAQILEEMDFFDIKISLKASDVLRTVEAYSLAAQSIPQYPLHLGVTEAGSILAGSIKSSLGIGILLERGIGDTIRVSLTGDPVEEVRVGFAILRNLGLRSGGLDIVSCPNCGRLEGEIASLVNDIEKEFASYKNTVRIAVMGCSVNGPGESREADIGVIAAGGDTMLFYESGKFVKKINRDEIISEIRLALERISSR